MSSKHLFSSSEGLVVKSLRGLIAYNPSLSLIESSKVVFDSTHGKDTVSIISGGGSGHEPSFAGFVGTNMLSASVSGDIFASPSTKQIMEAVDAVPSDKGTILVIINYTGDALNFGLACEKTRAKNKSPCGMIIVGDDVSVGKKGGLVGRRGLAAQVLVLKLLGAASGSKCSFEQCMTLGTAVADQTASICATLDHCHVPGRTEHATLKDDEIELGTGPHNEPGYRKISPIPSASDFLATVLKYLLDESDPERGYVHFEKGDAVVLMISNFGGISPLELTAIADEVLEQLERKYQIAPVRVYTGSILTSLNAPAFSTSLINLAQASKKAGFTVDQMFEFLETKTSTQWEGVTGHQIHRRPRKAQLVEAPKIAPREIGTDLKIDPKTLDASLRRACNDLIAAEPDLTKWDTVLGDGDCGETLKTGATALLSALDAGVAKNGSVVAVLHEVESIVESKMGGTLGGILGIFFVGLTSALQRQQDGQAGQSGANLSKAFGIAAVESLKNLNRYTPAKVGDRTVMDVFIPFAEKLQSTGDLKEAVKAAVDGAEGTRTLTPRLGRATYIGGMEGKELPPDPGAWGAMVVVKGLSEGLQG